MDRMTEQAALLALLKDRRSGWNVVADTVEMCGSAYKVLMQGEPGEQAELFSEGPSPDERLHAARAAIEQWLAEGTQLVTLLDDEYPSQLLTIHQRPPFLFYKGQLDERDAGGVAVVGTRNPSEKGRRKAAEIATGLAAKNVPVISGLAAGIDTAAHRGALDTGGRTVGVIGTGIFQHYPKENVSLQDELSASHLVLSQFWPKSNPTRTSFPMRNAVMSGFAAATVVVEAAWKSGARMQARLALQHGRPVLLLEDLLEHDWAREYAGWPGTHVVKGPDDVLAQLDDILAPTAELVWS
jgi:DNA processing protein